MTLNRLLAYLHIIKTSCFKTDTKYLHIVAKHAIRNYPQLSHFFPNDIFFKNHLQFFTVLQIFFIYWKIAQFSSKRIKKLMVMKVKLPQLDNIKQ